MSKSLRLIGFPNSGLLVFHAGMEIGFFENYATPVSLEVTPSSIYQLVNLIDGKFDIACGAVDNFIAYQENAGEETPKNNPDLAIFMGATQIELSLVAGPGIQTIEDLRGTEVAMDAISTGFAFVLYKMLDNAGLRPGDYSLVSVGATPHRWQGVKDGNYSCTLLIEPFTSQAKALGYKVLCSSRDVFKNYPGQMFGVMRRWANSNEDRIVGFIKGYLDALNWVLNENNTDSARNMLLRHMPQLNPKTVVPALETLRNPGTGLVSDGLIDREGLKTVLELRSKYAANDKPLSDIEEYIDETFYRRVINLPKH